jgi:preprotein translocase subunit YajC
MWTDAWAQAAGSAPPDPTIAMLVQFGPIIFLFAVMYFLLIRPQQQRQKKLESMIKALKKGDRVLTSGGMFGTVIGVDESKAVLRIADDVKAEFTKSAIVQVIAEGAGS